MLQKHTRYIPFTQQRYCCVPACLMMVMYRHEIPLIPQEDLAYALGLTVPSEDMHLFEKARTGKRPSAGWGTRIYEPEFEINAVLKSLGIPMQVDVDTHIDSKETLREKLQKVQDEDGDALLCFDFGVLWQLDVKAGHVCIFDRLEGDDVWIIDPERNEPKRRKTTIAQLYKAMDFHGPHNSCGVWKVKLLLKT